MNLYLLLRTLHILFLATLFGVGPGSACYALRAWHSGQLPVVTVTFRRLVTVDRLLIAITVVFQLLSGLTMARVAGWSLAQGWLLWSLGLHVFARPCWLPVVQLWIRARDMARTVPREARSIEPLACRYMNAWFILGWSAFIASTIIFYLMVSKLV